MVILRAQLGVKGAWCDEEPAKIWYRTGLPGCKRENGRSGFLIPWLSYYRLLSRSSQHERSECVAQLAQPGILRATDLTSSSHDQESLQLSANARIAVLVSDPSESKYF